VAEEILRSGDPHVNETGSGRGDRCPGGTVHEAFWRRWTLYR